MYVGLLWLLGLFAVVVLIVFCESYVLLVVHNYLYKVNSNTSLFFMYWSAGGS